MNLIKEKLIEYLMDNPSLSEEVDYLPDSERYKIYTEQATQLTDREALEEIHATMTGSELMDFIEALASEVENERQRADGLSDTLDRMHEGSHEDSRIISHDENKDLERNSETLNSVFDIQSEIKEVLERQAMGVQTFESLKDLIEKFVEMDLE